MSNVSQLETWVAQEKEVSERMNAGAGACVVFELKAPQ